jgi:hypothetical protein
MTLENLLRIGSLKRHQPSDADLLRLLGAAHQGLKDTEIPGLSAGSRFDMAYKAIMQCALLAMMANGFRPSSNAPGHHATIIQSLPKSIGIQKKQMALLDQLRHKRNLHDYTGMDVSEKEADACMLAAAELFDTVEAWLREHRPVRGANR